MVVKFFYKIVKLLNEYSQMQTSVNRRLSALQERNIPQSKAENDDAKISPFHLDFIFVKIYRFGG